MPPLASSAGVGCFVHEWVSSGMNRVIRAILPAATFLFIVFSVGALTIDVDHPGFRRIEAISSSLLAFLLLLVTTVYTTETEKIASGAEQQVEEARQQVKVAREHLQIEYRPNLVLLETKVLPGQAENEQVLELCVVNLGRHAVLIQEVHIAKVTSRGAWWSQGSWLVQPGELMLVGPVRVPETGFPRHATLHYLYGSTGTHRHRGRWQVRDITPQRWLTKTISR